jgi:hypothetical protein
MVCLESRSQGEDERFSVEMLKILERAIRIEQRPALYELP